METKQKNEELLNKLSSATPEELAQMLGCQVSDIYVGDIDDETEGFDSIPYRVVVGDVDISMARKFKDLGKLEAVIGYVSVGEWSKFGNDIDSLKNLKYVTGSLHAAYIQLEDIGALTAVGGDAFFDEAWIESTANLEYVGGDLSFEGCEKLYGVPKLKAVGGNILLNGSGITDLTNLEYLGKEVEAENFIEMNPNVVMGGKTR